MDLEIAYAGISQNLSYTLSIGVRRQLCRQGRVGSQEAVGQAEDMTQDWYSRAHYHLQGWGEYRRICRGSISKGYPVRSAFLATGGSSAEFDDLVSNADFSAARICDSCINDLAYLYQKAIESEYLMQGVIRHNRISTQDLLTDAMAAFWELAKKWLD